MLAKSELSDLSLVYWCWIFSCINAVCLITNSLSSARYKQDYVNTSINSAFQGFPKCTDSFTVQKDKIKYLIYPRRLLGKIWYRINLKLFKKWLCNHWFDRSLSSNKMFEKKTPTFTRHSNVCFKNFNNCFAP